MKQKTILILVLILALFLVACQDQQQDQAAEEQDTVETVMPDEVPPPTEEEVAEAAGEAAGEEAEADDAVAPDADADDAEADDAAADDTAEQPVVQPMAMEDPSVLPPENFEMFVDGLPVEGWGKTLAPGAPLDLNAMPSNNGFPPFVFIDFSSPGDAKFPDPAIGFDFDLPQGRIFPVLPYVAMYQEVGSDYPTTALQDLVLLLQNHPETLDNVIHTLPGFGDSQQGVRGKPVYIDFDGGTGVAFVAGYGREIGPLLNDTLVYQFIGATTDGSQYISFMWPLDAAFLSDLDSVTQEEIDLAEADLEAYLANMTDQIAAASDSDFTPDLSTLNAAMQSIVITGVEAVAAETPAFPISEPDYNSKLVRDLSPFQEALDGFSAERAAEMDSTLTGKTVLEIQEMMDSGQLTAVELVTYYVSRIEQYDIGILNSVMELNPEALEIAAQLDEERASGSARGSMHGIPVLLKANIATGDQMKTTAGAVAMQDWQPDRDAFLVQQLRDAGAIIMGKANLSEWANYMDPNNPNGFTALGGQTRAAYGPYDPLGSSTGSAVSVAANLTTVSVGSETQGSIIAPSTVNSVAGLKTSRGLVSGDYIIPLVDWMDVPGPIGRSVTDVAVLLTAMTGTNDNDPASQDASELAGTDFTQFLSMKEAQKVRVGVVGPPESLLQQQLEVVTQQAGRELTPEETAVLAGQISDFLGDAEDIAAVLTANGIETVIIMSDEDVIPTSENKAILEYGFQDSFNNFMTTLGDNAPHSSLADIVAFNNEDLANRAPYGQGFVEGSVNTAVTAEEYEALKENNMQNGVDALHALFEKYDVDIIIFRVFTQEYAPAGFPALTVPAGYAANGMPISVILVGDYLSEPQLISVGYAYEQEAQARVEPDLDARMQQIAPVVSAATVPEGDDGQEAASEEPVIEGETTTAAEGTNPLTANLWSWSGYTDPVEGPLNVLVPGELYSLEFLSDGRVIIFAGCNIAIGSTTIDNGSISIDTGQPTQAVCGPDSLSERYTGLLSGAASYTLDDDKLLVDLMADGGTMEFTGYPVMEMGDQLATLGVMFAQINAADETPPTTAEELADSALQNLVVHEGDNPLSDFSKSPGAVVLVDTPDGRVLKADGFASVEDQTPVQTSDRFEIGSNSKMFLGVLLAQLQEEGVLSMDDQLSQWLPEIAAQLPNGDDMTLRQLVTHTAGVWDYGNSIIGAGIVSPELLTKSYSPQEIVDFVIEYGHPDFAPGEEGRWKYSNSGFILLGMVIEAATGQEYADLLQERIFDPLQMNDTIFLEDVPEPGSIVNGYFNYPFAINVTDWNASQGWAAGSIASTAEDIAKFAAALMHGDLFQDPQTLDVMTDFIEVSEDTEVANVGGIGYGTGLIEFAPGLWGHNGQTAGFTSMIAIDPEQEFVFIMLTNSAEGAVGLEQDPIGQFLNIEMVGEE